MGEREEGTLAWATEVTLGAMLKPRSWMVLVGTVLIICDEKRFGRIE